LTAAPIEQIDGIALPTAVLLDTPNPPSPLHVERPGAMAPGGVSSNPEMPRIWVWDASRSPMPPLPGANGQWPAECKASPTRRMSATSQS